MKDNRESPFEMGGDEFKNIGYHLVDAIAGFLETIKQKPVTTGETPKQIQQILGNAPLPNDGTAATEIINRATELLFTGSHRTECTL